MKRDDAARLALLKRLRLKPDDLQRLLGAIRQSTDDEILALLAPPARAKQEAALGDLVRARLQPILASAQEKADALQAALDPSRRAPRGLAATVTALAKRFGREAVLAAADALVTDIARSYDRRDVVP